MNILDTVQKELSDLGFTVGYENNCAIIEKGEKYFSFKWKEGNVSTLVVTSQLPKIKFRLLDALEEKDRKKFQYLLLKGIEDYAKQSGYAFVHPSGSNFGRFVKEFDYKEDPYGRMNGLIKEVIPGGLKQLDSLCQSIWKLFYNRKEKDITFSFDNVNHFYYEGYDGFIELNYEKDHFTIKEMNQKEEYPIKKEEDAKKAVQEILKKVHQKRRLINLINPPMRYFENYLTGTYSEERKKTLFHALSEKIKPKEIEELSAKNIQDEIYSQYKSYLDYKIYKIFHYYVIYYKETGMVIAIEDSKENMIQAVKEDINKRLEHELAEKITF